MKINLTYLITKNCQLIKQFGMNCWLAGKPAGIIMTKKRIIKVYIEEELNTLRIEFDETNQIAFYVDNRKREYKIILKPDNSYKVKEWDDKKEKWVRW